MSTRVMSSTTFTYPWSMLMPHSKVKSPVTSRYGVSSFPFARSSPPWYSGKYTTELHEESFSATKRIFAFTPFWTTITAGVYPSSFTVTSATWPSSVRCATWMTSTGICASREAPEVELPQQPLPPPPSRTRKRCPPAWAGSRTARGRAARSLAVTFERSETTLMLLEIIPIQQV